MVNVAIACITAFIKTSFPAFDSSLSLHPLSFLAIRSLSSLKAFSFDLPIKAGKPKYYSYWVRTCTPHISLISVCLTFGVFLQKKIAVFSLLIFFPNVSSYRVRVSMRFVHSSALTWQNKGLSSTKSKCYPRDTLYKWRHCSTSYLAPLVLIKW